MAFGSEQWMYNAGGGFYPHEIDQSLRFDTNAYLSRTPSSSGNRKTWTWSAWVKRGNLGSTESLFGAYTDSNNRLYLHFGPSNTIKMFGKAGGTTSVNFESDALFRDASSWYHVTLVMDTTQATASSRTKLYVNGLQQTITFSTTPSLNSEPYINAAAAHLIGDLDGSVFFNGYMAEVNFVDGQALDASYFGETKSGVWIPKRYSGTYGTNGFHLDFATRATDPIDASGNGNNWSSVNVVSTDWMLDSPTNNFCTFSPAALDRNRNYAPYLVEGNLRIERAILSQEGGSISAPMAVSSGKWYFEGELSEYLGSSPLRIGFNTDDNFYGAGSVYKEVSANGLYMIAIDIDNKLYWTGANGTWDAGDPDLGTGGTSYTSTTDSMVPFVRDNSASVGNGGTWTLNFGQDSSFAGNKTRQGNTDANGIGDFYYAPPAGYLALCSANLPETAIDPAEDDIPADYFNPVTYTGNGTGQSITGVGFQPDWVWIKSRSDVDNNVLQDSVRGVTKQLFSSTTDAETSYTNGVTSFDADGFTVATSNWSNENGQTRVAWNWKAGGSAVANTDGTIASQVSASPKAGFSIVSYTGQTTADTVGHGLEQPLDFIIVKNRDTTNQWAVYSRALGSDVFTYLNNTQAAVSGNTSVWNNTDPTSSVFSIGTSNSTSGASSGDELVAYCFHSVEGFSKFGSYTGNGSADGPFVYTGFRPAYVMVKRTSNSGEWTIYDNKRSAFNLTDKNLKANNVTAEVVSGNNSIDIVSNGFKLRGFGSTSNASGDTYIYMAFAEMPYKYANAR